MFSGDLACLFGVHALDVEHLEQTFSAPVLLQFHDGMWHFPVQESLQTAQMKRRLQSYDKPRIASKSTKMVIFGLLVAIWVQPTYVPLHAHLACHDLLFSLTLSQDDCNRKSSQILYQQRMMWAFDGMIWDAFYGCKLYIYICVVCIYIKEKMGHTGDSSRITTKKWSDMRQHKKTFRGSRHSSGAPRSATARKSFLGGARPNFLCNADN